MGVENYILVSYFPYMTSAPVFENFGLMSCHKGRREGLLLGAVVTCIS